MRLGLESKDAVTLFFFVKCCTELRSTSSGTSPTTIRRSRIRPRHRLKLRRRLEGSTEGSDLAVVQSSRTTLMRVAGTLWHQSLSKRTGPDFSCDTDAKWQQWQYLPAEEREEWPSLQGSRCSAVLGNSTQTLKLVM